MLEQMIPRIQQNSTDLPNLSSCPSMCASPRALSVPLCKSVTHIKSSNLLLLHSCFMPLAMSQAHLKKE